MWDIVRELVADGVTILLTTQYLEEADRVADRVAVLDRGRIVGEGSPAELKSRRRLRGAHRPRTRRRTDPRDPHRRHRRRLRHALERHQRRALRSPVSVRAPRPRRRLLRPHRHHAAAPTEGARMTTIAPRPSSDSVTMLRRNLLHMSATPDSPASSSAARSCSCCCSSTSSAAPSAPDCGGGPDGTSRTTSPTSCPASCSSVSPASPGPDLGRPGHDRGHRRPVPLHGHLPRRRAHRARARQHHPGPAVPRRRPRRRPPHGPTTHRRTPRLARPHRLPRPRLLRRRLGRGRDGNERQSPSRPPATPR